MALSLAQLQRASSAAWISWNFETGTREPRGPPRLTWQTNDVAPLLLGRLCSGSAAPSLLIRYKARSALSSSCGRSRPQSGAKA